MVAVPRWPPNQGNPTAANHGELVWLGPILKKVLDLDCGLRKRAARDGKGGEVMGVESMLQS